MSDKSHSIDIRANEDSLSCRIVRFVLRR